MKWHELPYDQCTWEPPLGSSCHAQQQDVYERLKEKFSLPPPAPSHVSVRTPSAAARWLLQAWRQGTDAVLAPQNDAIALYHIAQLLPLVLEASAKPVMLVCL